MSANKLGIKLTGLAAALLVATSAAAVEFVYQGEFNFCLGTCDSFAALGGEAGGSANTVNSIITGTLNVTPDANGAFEISADDAVPFNFEILNEAVALQEPLFDPAPGCDGFSEPGDICNLGRTNPLPVDERTAIAQGSGQIGANGELISGSLNILFTTSPFVNNSADLIFDLASGSGEGRIFSGFITFLLFEGGFARTTDADGDGVFDGFDNCIALSNADQRDTNGDGFGNACDADLNSDCVVNVVDLGLLRSVFFEQDDDADFDGDGVVNVVDLGVLRSAFFAPPGPSGTSMDCAQN